MPGGSAEQPPAAADLEQLRQDFIAGNIAIAEALRPGAEPLPEDRLRALIEDNDTCAYMLSRQLGHQAIERGGTVGR